MYYVFRTGKVASKVDAPVWLLVVGAVGACCGIATLGYPVLRNMGSRITYHSPVRGFCMEIGTALTLLTATFLAIPVSSTQCIFGATAAIGICNGNLKALNWRIVFWTFFSWLITLPVTGVIAGLLFSLMSRSPTF